VAGLLKIYSVLDKIEPVSKDDLSYRPVKEMYYYPLAAGLMVTVLMALLAVFSALFPGIFARTPAKPETISGEASP